MADHNDGVSRRKALKCMAWAGTGVLWTISRGVAHSLGLLDQVMAPDTGGLTFLQISDSHVGFAKPVNPNVKGTLEEAISRIKTMPVKPSFVIHTGDITHLSKASEFDDAEHIISQAQLDVHYVPGEHDVLDPEVKLYLERFGRGTKGAGWYSFDANGVHFMGLVNVATGGRFMGYVDVDNPGGKAGGLGMLGDAQLEWIEDDLKGRSASTPLVVFAHMPLWSVYLVGLSELGLGHRRQCSGAGVHETVRLGDRAQRTYPSGGAEGRRQRDVPHRALDSLPVSGAGHRACARTDESTSRQAAHHDRLRKPDIQAGRAAARHRRCPAAGLSADHDENSFAVPYLRRYAFTHAEEQECFVGCFCGRLVSLCLAWQLSGS